MRKLVLVLAVAAATARAFTPLPAVGYSESSGFILGGYLFHDSGPKRFTLNTYYGTAGVIKFQPGAVVPLGDGLFSTTLGFRKVLERKYYGWGNDTQPDSFSTMDFEKADLIIDFTLPLSRVFSFTAGLEVRHSSVFNRSDGDLWEDLPGKVFASTWTSGLSGELCCSVPHSGSLSSFCVRSFFQSGEETYGGVTGTVKESLRTWPGGKLLLGTRIHRQFGIENTPLPYTSGIGQNTNFRGYSDYRFTGSVWTLHQVELENDLVSVRDSLGNPVLIFAIASFFEAGQTSGKFSSLSVSDLHTDYGFGIRMRLPDEAVMRLDAAWGDEGMLLQSGFDSAF